ncbi:NAD-dependent epimerase/dehydratase family protein [Epibacterium ulvae]|uniref:NAD-dependent epimerase/dehydratase family protein n=1 Tax=Epibacterium ulvae TaxID=1156985 RepID=UPI00203E66C4|nr:NAD(P)-dependent oxidoreductase [Epibacterium ulvae]
MKQLLLTGASGGMATALRSLITDLAEKVVLSAPEKITDLAAHEESRAADLGDLAAVNRANGMPRFLFASSSHVVGYYKQSETVDASAMPRPDSLYGMTKTFGEALARFYFEKFGQKTAILRIG